MVVHKHKSEDFHSAYKIKVVFVCARGEEAAPLGKRKFIEVLKANHCMDRFIVESTGVDKKEYF